MRRFIQNAAAVGAVLLVGAWAACAHGQVVQLPTVGVTSVATTVSVPDRGAAYLGGIGRSSEGSVSRGIGPGRLLGNRAIGSSTSAGAITAHATIMNLDELDAAVLAEAEHRRGLVGAGGAAGFADRRGALTGKAAFISRNVARRGGSRVSSQESLASTIGEDREESETEMLLREAEAAAKAGKKGVAQVYYQMAERRASGDLKVEIQSRLAALDAPPAQTRIASRRR
jgi:hypothetical protein